MDSGEFPPGSLIFHICDFKTTYWRFAALRLSWIGDGGRLPEPSGAGCKSCHLCPLRSRVGQVPVLLDKAAVAQVRSSVARPPHLAIAGRYGETRKAFFSGQRNVPMSACV